jgi:hypothetical protein
MTCLISGIILAAGGGLLLLPVGLLAFAFWIWMIVDCAKYETRDTTKIAWLLIIFLIGVIGAPLYFFLRHIPRQSAARHQITSHVYQPWQKDARIR